MKLVNTFKVNNPEIFSSAFLEALNKLDNIIERYYYYLNKMPKEYKEEATNYYYKIVEEVDEIQRKYDIKFNEEKLNSILFPDGGYLDQESYE